MLLKNSPGSNLVNLTAILNKGLQDAKLNIRIHYLESGIIRNSIIILEFCLHFKYMADELVFCLLMVSITEVEVVSVAICNIF